MEHRVGFSPREGDVGAATEGTTKKKRGDVL